MPPSRRAVLRLSAAALGVPLGGCVSGVLDRDDPDPGDPPTEETTAAGETTPDPTTHELAVDTSLPDGEVDLPDGPKSRPDHPEELTRERVREYAKTVEYRWLYNRLAGDETTEVRVECGVESVTEYGEGYRVVVRCSASANGGRGETTVHADYFARYATYFVGPDTAVRRDGKTDG